MRMVLKYYEHVAQIMSGFSGKNRQYVV